MKRQYNVEVFGDRYPYKTTLEAATYAIAVNRAVRAWRKSTAGKGSRTNTLTVRVIRGA